MPWTEFHMHKVPASVLDGKVRMVPSWTAGLLCVSSEAKCTHLLLSQMGSYNGRRSYHASWLASCINNAGLYSHHTKVWLLQHMLARVPHNFKTIAIHQLTTHCMHAHGSSWNYACNRKRHARTALVFNDYIDRSNTWLTFDMHAWLIPHTWSTYPCEA